MKRDIAKGLAMEYAKSFILLAMLPGLMSCKLFREPPATCGAPCSFSFYEQPEERVLLLLDDSFEDVADDEGYLSLHWAAREGTPKQLALLIDQADDVNARANNGRTPLHEAAMASSPENAKLLLDAGAKINAVDHVGFTPLHAAAMWGNPLIIAMLKKRGAVDHLEDHAGRKVADMLAPAMDNSALAEAENSVILEKN